MKRILIIEDNAAIAGIYRNKFARRGFVAEVASDGQDGLQKIEKWKPDLVVLDLMIPKIDGLSLLRTMRSTPATRELPVIVYSSMFVQSTEEARNLGVTRLLSKSDTRPEQLLDIAAEVLGVASPEETAASERSDRTVCLQAALKIAGEMRPLLKEFFAHDEASLLVTMQYKAHLFTANAWTAGLQRAALVGEALEALLRTLCERPDYVNFSTEKTVLQSIECLECLANASGMDPTPLRSPHVLIVDDQELSLLAATRAIKKARMRAFVTADPIQAIKLLEAHTFDLVVLDIEMPNMDGNRLCRHLRRLPWQENTPVIFFSQLSEIEDRMRAATVGGSDFIVKPFLTIELALKALVWVWKPKERKAES